MTTCRQPLFDAMVLSAVLLFSATALQLRAGEGGSENTASEAFRASYAAEKAIDYEDAIKALLPLKDLPATRYASNLRLGWLYYCSGNFANSRNAYQSALKVNPSSLEAKVGYLLPVLAQGNYDEAEAVCKQITDADRYNYYANLRWAFALRMQRKFLLAEKINLQMLTFYPADVTLMTEEALCKVGMLQKDPAKKMFAEIIALDPDNATAKYYLSKP